MKKQRHSYLLILVAVMTFFVTANLVIVSAAGASKGNILTDCMYLIFFRDLQG